MFTARVNVFLSAVGLEMERQVDEPDSAAVAVEMVGKTSFGRNEQKLNSRRSVSDSLILAS